MSDFHEIEKLADASRTNIRLTHAERVRAFYWLRDQARDALVIARQLERAHAVPPFAEADRQTALALLIACEHIFPMTRDGETKSVESIVNGQVPYPDDPREQQPEGPE